MKGMFQSKFFSDLCREVNLKLSPKKLKFFKKSSLSESGPWGGIEPDHDKINNVKNWPKPRNAYQVLNLFGFIVYYRRCIDGFLTIVVHLMTSYKILRRKQKRMLGHQKNLTCENVRLNKNNRPRLRSSFQLHTDPSSSSISAVLYQTQYNCKGAIAYTSRILSKFEKNYSIY